MKHRHGRFRALAIDAVVLVLRLGPVLYLAVEYHDLPQRIPVHGNAFGEPDRWPEKNPATVLMAVACKSRSIAA